VIPGRSHKWTGLSAVRHTASHPQICLPLYEQAHTTNTLNVRRLWLAPHSLLALHSRLLLPPVRGGSLRSRHAGGGGRGGNDPRKQTWGGTAVAPAVSHPRVMRIQQMRQFFKSRRWAWRPPAGIHLGGQGHVAWNRLCPRNLAREKLRQASGAWAIRRAVLCVYNYVSNKNDKR